MRFGDLLLSMLTSVDNNRLDISKLLKGARHGSASLLSPNLESEAEGSVNLRLSWSM